MPEIDIVVNLTTPNAHFEVSHAALTAGKHVFSEKPLCVAREDGHRLVRRRTRGLKFGCAPDTFLGAGGRLAREMVDGGKVGIDSGRLVLPDVAWHGALASEPGILSSSRAAVRSSTWGPIISPRCAI